MDSGYYFGLLQKYSYEKKQLEEKKDKWLKYLKNLNVLRSKLPNIVSKLNSCSSSLLGGGYVDNGVSLDNGKLKKNANILENDCNILSNIIDKTQKGIDEFTNKIDELSKLIEDTNKKYYEAKKLEIISQKTFF